MFYSLNAKFKDKDKYTNLDRQKLREYFGANTGHVKNKDGEVTKADILIGRGGIPREQKSKGGVARGCGAIMKNRRKKTKMYA